MCGEEDEGSRGRRVWEKMMAEDAASEKAVAIGSVGWELFSLEMEKVGDLVDSSEEEEADEEPYVSDDETEADNKLWAEIAIAKKGLKEKKVDAKADDELWVKVEKKGNKETAFKDKGFKENRFVKDNKYINSNESKPEIKKWETKNRFEDLSKDEMFEVQQKTELSFGNMMKNKENKRLIQAKTKIKVNEAETNSICQNRKCIDFTRSDRKPNDKEINNIDKGNKVRRKGKVTVDSGAEDSVWPATHVDWDKVVETEESRKGIGFVAANGGRMANYGGTKVEFVKEGKRKSMNFQVTDCKKPLASVSKIVDKGNRVVFDSEGSYIENKATGEIMKLERERGTYVMIVEYETTNDVASASGFPGQN
jgi:hypothetical protein